MLARVEWRGKGKRIGKLRVVGPPNGPRRRSLAAEELRDAILVPVQKRVYAVGRGQLDDGIELVEIRAVVLAAQRLDARPKHTKT